MNRLPQMQLSKLQLALLVGTPLVVATGYYIYQKSTTRSKSNPKDEVEPTVPRENKQNLESSKATEIVTPLKDANNHKADGNIFYRNGKFAEAIKCYDKAIEACPKENKTDMAIFYQNRAAAYEMLQKWKEVKEDCSKSIEYNPRYPKAYFRRAKAHEACKNVVDSLNDITACCILETFQNENTILFADRILKLSGKEDAERNFDKREPTLPSAQFISTYLNSFAHDPLQTGLIIPDELKENNSGFVRAKLALNAGRYEDVINACTEEIESSESESQYKMEALLLRGTFHLLSGNFKQSRLDLSAVIDNVDASKTLRCHAYIKRASLNIQTEKTDEGLADFESAEKIAPENADIYHQRAQIYMLLGELGKSLEEFEKVLKLAPNHAYAYVQKCYTEYRFAFSTYDHTRLMRTIDDFRSSIEKFPECVECYSLLAQVLSDQQQFEQSDQFFLKAIAIAPKQATLYVHRAIMHLRWKGNVENAIALLERAISIDSKCEIAYESLGTLEVQRARLDRAVELFEKAILLAKSKSEMCQLYSLRNAALAQELVTKQLGIDIKALQQSNEAVR